MLVSEGHAAASLAQAVGRAVGYDTTALLFVETGTPQPCRSCGPTTARWSRCSAATLHSADAMAVLTEMAEAVAAQDAPPQGMFVVGSGVDVSSVKAHLEHLVSLPVSAPEDAGAGAGPRGGAGIGRARRRFEASTVGLAYSQDPDGPPRASVYPGLAGIAQMAASAPGAPAERRRRLGRAGIDEVEPTEAPRARGREPQAVPARR